jgi:hypothetical protein
VYWYASELASERKETTPTSYDLQKRNEWSDEVFDSISWAAYGSASAGLTDSLRTFVVKFGHSWLPIGVRGNDDAALRLIFARNAPKLRRFLICTAARPEHRGVIDF